MNKEGMCEVRDDIMTPLVSDQSSRLARMLAVTTGKKAWARAYGLRGKGCGHVQMLG
jgi:hypothetical protein